MPFQPAVEIVEESEELTMRPATSADIGAVAHLCRSLDDPGRALTNAEISTLIHHGWLLVLEHDDGSIVATVHVRVAGSIGVIDHLLVHPRYSEHDVRDQLTDVAEAFCTALGVPDTQPSASPSMLM